MIIVLVLVVLIAGIVAVTSNRDAFSPGKFFLAFYVLFHAGALFEPPSDNVLGLTLMPLLLVVILVIAEAVKSQYRPFPALRADREYNAIAAADRFPTVLIWALTIPSLAAQWIAIQQFGGLEGYVSSINTRVVDWSGLGWARVMIASASALNVALFAIGLIGNRSRRWWTSYAVHLAIVLVFGLLSGSRSGLLNILALLACTYHYMRKPVSMPAAGGLVVFLVTTASLLGIARNGFKLDGGQVTTGLANTTESFSFNSFTYGIDPLVLITSTPTLTLAKGSTFLSLVTNAIPRALYPEKPDTGGVFFTKNYAGDAWEGLSNLTPTFLGEWIINFGYFAGILAFTVVYGGMMWFVLSRYLTLLRTPARRKDQLFAIDLAIYLHVLWALVGLMVGELTSVILGLALNSLAPLTVIRILMARREQASMGETANALRRA